MNILKDTPRKVLIAFASVLFLAIVSSVGWVTTYSKYKVLKNPEIATQEELKEIISRVERFMVLPQDETPTLATVSDPEKLREQPFFANAQIGDKVLIYSQSRKAILWRPSSGKIIELSSVTPSETTSVSP